MIVSSVSPGTYSITMKKTLSCFSAVMTVTMFGWFSEASRRGSRSSSPKSRPCRCGTLMRDALVDPRVFGEIHRAEPAAAERLEDAVLAERLAAKHHSREV